MIRLSEIFFALGIIWEFVSACTVFLFKEINNFAVLAASAGIVFTLAGLFFSYHVDIKKQ